MGIPVVRPPKIRDHEDQYQRDARNAIRDLDVPGARKIMVRGVVLASGVTNRVAHGLGRIPTNWLVVDKNAQADVWRDTSFTATNDLIGFRASAAVTVDIQFW